jgi:organic hydroperoxide reductase OsmC/OhrA
LFTKIFCPTDAHTFPARAHAAMFPPLLTKKNLEYETELFWILGRIGLLQANNNPKIQVSSPPEFHGEAGLWTAEDIYVGAINTSLMTTFLDDAEKKKLKILSYKSHAVGTLEYKEGKNWLTLIEITPKIEVDSIGAAAKAERAIFEAYHNCLLSNSIKSKVIVTPEIKVDDVLVRRSTEIQFSKV